MKLLLNQRETGTPRHKHVAAHASFTVVVCNVAYDANRSVAADALVGLDRTHDVVSPRRGQSENIPP